MTENTQDVEKIYTCQCGRSFTKAPALSRHRAEACKNNPNRVSRQNRKTPEINEVVENTNESVENTPQINKSNELVISSSPYDKNTSNELVESNFSLDKSLPSDLVISNTPKNKSILKKLDKLQVEFDQLKQSLIEKAKPNCFNIDKIQIFITDPIDFVDVFTERLGCRQKAIDYIKSKVNHKIEGDVSLFCDIYLNGDLDTWPISCLDKKNLLYRVAQPNQEAINDPGGLIIYKHFRNAYANTLLRLSNEELAKTFKYIPGTDEYELQRDILMDEFDLNLFQKKAQDLYLLSYEPFVKKLTVKCNMLEKSLKSLIELG